MWGLLRAALFRLPPESAHELARVATRLFPGFLRSSFFAARAHRPLAGRLSFMGFQGRVGLAAGFDKNAQWLFLLPSLGFSFAEVGTVTPKPQGGNLPPRLFRDPSTFSLFNRMGFNNLGARIVSERVKLAREGLPNWFRVGVNLGKNKDTSADDAHVDYARAAAEFQGAADFFVINVSSPNTQGLRELQNIESLKRILGAVQAESRGVPVWIKLAPELKPSNDPSRDELRALFSALELQGAAGWVLTNTLASQEKLEGMSGAMPGGWSGGKVREIAREFLREARALTQKPLISVGGIDSVAEAMERKKLGADLVELYTGWIYGGPALPKNIEKALF